jgi:predicted phosphoribosyltransferase
MDDQSIDRWLHEAPLEEFREGHITRFESRIRARNWKSVAVLAAAVAVVFGAAMFAWFVPARKTESPSSVFVAVPVYWSRAHQSTQLDISRWTCVGCRNETNERPVRREGVMQ